MNPRLALAMFGIAITVATPAAQAGVVFGANTNSLSGGIYRWDAAPRTISGNERSLDGGLRYSLSGGSYQAFRDQFTWSILPSVADFTAAIQGAFSAWSAVDPASGFGTALNFVFDANSTAQGVTGGGININGAEIDLIATTDAWFWNPGNAGRQGETWFDGINSPVTLTSGITGYANSRAISGADIYLNSNTGAAYTLDVFRRLLTHELGHALGLGDVEADINASFIDDNFDPTSNATKVATLNNSWTTLVNPLDPSGSAGLHIYNIGVGTTGLSGVDLLMESRGLGISAGNPSRISSR